MGKVNVDWVEGRNFFSYGNRWTRVDFQEGVNLVLGHDKEKGRSNTAGKTSFLEMVPFALFGQTSKGVSQGKIVNWVNGKDCEVRLGFRHNGIPYVIHRGIKPGKLDLYKDGVKLEKLSDKRMFQQELETDLIGMDFKSAQMVTFQNANNMVSIFKTSKEDKRRFIEKFFNLEVYSKMNEQVNKKLQTILEKLSGINQDKAYKTQRIQELEAEISRMVLPEIDRLKGIVDEQNRLWQELRNDTILTIPLEEFSSELYTLGIERDECDFRMSSANDELMDKTQKVAAMNAQKEMLERQMAAIGDLSEKRIKVEKIKEGLARLTNIDQQIVECKESVEQKRKDMDSLAMSMSSVTMEIKSLQRKLKELSDIRTKTDGLVECPTCFQSVSPEHLATHIGTLEHDTNETMKIRKQENEYLEEQYTRVGTGYNQLEATLRTLEDRRSTKAKLEVTLATLSNLDQQESTLAELSTQYSELIPKMVIAFDIQTLKDSVAQYRLRRNEVVDRIQFLSESLRKYDEVTGKIDNARQMYEASLANYNDQQAIYASLAGEKMVKITACDQLKTELEGFVTSTEKLNKMKDYMEYIKVSLKDENVKQYAISNIIPFLQQQTNHYLAETGHNYYIELDAWLDGEIKGHGVGECDFGNMSGGEGKSIDLALKFAMMDVARRQAGSYLDILVLDELLDSSIDSFGLEKLMEIVRLKQREDGLKVFIVSHREEMGDYDIDRTYKVTKDSGFSSIELV